MNFLQSIQAAGGGKHLKRANSSSSRDPRGTISILQGAAGIRNRGNTCFISAVLQSLVSLQPVLQVAETSNHLPLHAALLQFRFEKDSAPLVDDDVLGQRRQEVDWSFLQTCLDSLGFDALMNGDKQDSAEFLDLVINGSGGLLGQGKDGVFSCRTQRVDGPLTTLIYLDLPPEVVSESSSEGVEIDLDWHVKLKKPAKHTFSQVVDASSLDLWIGGEGASPPQVLMFVLKRNVGMHAKWDANKIHTRERKDKVLFPLRDLRLFKDRCCHEDCPFAIESTAQLQHHLQHGTPPPIDLVYDLAAVVNHEGPHFTCYAKHERVRGSDDSEETKKEEEDSSDDAAACLDACWLLYDDHKVLEIDNEESVITGNAYILFYSLSR